MTDPTSVLVLLWPPNQPPPIPDVSEDMLLQPQSAPTSAATTTHRSRRAMVLRPDCVTSPLSEPLPGLSRTGIPYADRASSVPSGDRPANRSLAPRKACRPSAACRAEARQQHRPSSRSMANAQPSRRVPASSILLAAPRGFCAGVDRAIKIVELALQKFGSPVYVRHEIVHNRHVVDSLKAKGAIFVEELDEIPETDAPVIFSAHGVPRAVPGRRQGAQPVLPRRHLSPRLQGACRGAPCTMRRASRSC